METDDEPYAVTVNKRPGRKEGPGSPRPYIPSTAPLPRCKPHTLVHFHFLTVLGPLEDGMFAGEIKRSDINFINSIPYFTNDRLVVYVINHPPASLPISSPIKFLFSSVSLALSLSLFRPLKCDVFAGNSIL